MNTFADYEAWKAKRQSAGVGAASVVIGAQEQSPDQLAGDMNLASEFGKVTGNPVPPVPMVGEYRSVFQAAIEKKRAETILSSSPRLTEWLRNPENAGVARDDLEGLSWWETGLGATWNATKRGAMRSGPQAYNQYQANVYAERAQDAGRSFGEILRDERTPILNAEGKEVDRVWAGPSDLLGAGYRYAASRLTNLWGQTAEQNAAQYQARAGQIANRIAQIPMSPGGEAGKARFMEAAKAEGWQAQLSAIGKAFTEAPGEMTSFLLQTAAESLPSIAAAAGVGVATRSPGAAAAVMGSTSFAAEYGSAPVEFFKEKGIDVSTPEGAMSVIRNPEIMREAEQRGITRGVIIGALDGLSGGIAGAKLAESALGNMVLQSITQAVLGAGGEAGAQVAAGQNFNLAEVVLEGLAEFVTAPVEVGSMAVSRVREVQAKARDAEARVGLFQELSGQAVASKLRARMPDRFRQFIEQATANGPVENVFVPAQEFVSYFQSVGVDPYELLGELDGVSRDDLDAALAGGGDLKIPTATYAAKIAGSEHDAFLMQNMRFDPMDMTAREAAEFNDRVDEVMAEMWAEAEDVRLEDEKWRAVEAKIYDDMVSRLRMAGRSTEVATTEAMIYPAFYRVMAERSGLSTEEFLERYPLPQVQGAVPQGMQFKNVDDLNRTLAELRSRVKPTTKQTPLLDFIAKRGGIDDVGGELKARNADGQLRPGMGRLARRLTEDGKPMPLTDAEMKSGVRFGWDYTAQAAVEAGFMADNPAVIEWKDAMAKGDRVAPDLTPVLLEEIDRELAGQGGTVDENTAALDEMEEYLSRLGVSLDDSDEAIRAVLEAAQAEDARMYGQDGQIATESDAFKRWFGDSVVTDADGKPLVVYHGTAADVGDNFAFDPKFIGSTGAAEGYGFYLTTDRDTAEGYMGRDGGSVVEAYVSMSKPMPVMQKGFSASVLQKIIDKVIDAEIAQGDAEDYRDTFVSNFVDTYSMSRRQAVREVAAIIAGEDRAIDQIAEIGNVSGDKVGTHRAVVEVTGFDGIVSDGYGGRGEAGGTIYVTWFPTQIKSVFNRGTFDPADPRILYQRGGALDGLLASVRENMARKASLSADLAAAGRPVMFSTADGRRAMAGPDMSKPGGFRLTYLGADGQPSGHSEFATLAEAIRRALDEGMEPSVAYQQAQDQDQPLYVVHNLSAEKLRHAADLGGLAAPSIAVARGDIGFNSFGEISLIGDPSMADPKKKGVRLFNADVYSPRQPRARYKVDKKAAAALNATLRPVAEKLGLPFDDIGAYDIERDGLSAVNGQMVAKAAWLESIGEAVPVVREEPEEPAPVNGMGMIKGTDPDALVTDPAFLARVQRKYELALSRYDGNADMIAKINAAWLDDAGNISAKMIRGWADQVAKANRAIEDFRAGTQPEGPVSRYLTGKAIDDAVGGRIGEFNGWVREEFGGLITDMFFETEAGRKKEYTLSNLVREMTRAIRNGENWNYGAGNVRAAVAPEFKALAEVKAARGQITDEKGMEALKTEVNNKLFALADKFAPFAGSEGKGFGWGDNFSEFLRDVAKGPRAVAEWPWAANVPDDLMAEAVAFLESLKSLPTNYFEIKMQRAVDLSEFTAALVPSDLAADARKILTDAGVELIEYQKGDDGEGRNAALQQIGQRVFFQRAYHGSPHLFEKFSLDKIGTGEGAQAFGWGLYFAGRKEVAEHYRESLSGGANGGAKRAIAKHNGDIDAAISDALAEIDRLNSLPDGGGDIRRRDGMVLVQRDKIRALEEFKANGRFGSGRLFQVEIPEDSELLDWDAPLSKQPEAVKEKLAQIGGSLEDYEGAVRLWENAVANPKSRGGDTSAYVKMAQERLNAAILDRDRAAGKTGAEFYAELQSRMGSDRAASEALRAAGIPGHRYLDGGSRADGEGSRNYVIYDDSRVEVSSFDQGPRGQISVTADGKSTIRLFESANLSTMLHESGHFFLLVMQDLAAKGEANAAAEYEAVKGWWRENAKAVAADANRAAGAMPGAYNQGGRTDTASDAFKRWFGDSKVVDADGKPLVVYHGGSFDENRDGAFATGRQFGFFFSPNKRLAQSYAPGAGIDVPVTSAYLRLENPFNPKDPDHVYAPWVKEWIDYWRESEGWIDRRTGEDMSDGDVFLMIEDVRLWDYEENGVGVSERWDDFLRTAQDHHDGFYGYDPTDGGVISVAFDPTQIKSVNNRGTFDPADPRILFQRGQPDFTDGDVTVTAEDVIRAIDTGTTGDSVKDMLVDVGMQEQWARAFEAYLMEGKAPSVELRSAFEKFRAWLISVYRRIAGLNVQISDDIRAVFDRMLASDAEIEKAKRTSGDTGNMFASAEEMGLTAEEYDRFLKLRAQAEDDAKARLMGEIMDPIKREQDKAYRAEKEKVRAEVERNINASPVYRAWEWMGNRRWLGDGQPANLPDMRLSKSVLVQRYGEGVLKTLPRGKQTIYAVDGGLDPDDAAGWFGFDSGDQMIRALERAPGRKEAITAETDRVMNERHNDPLTDGEIERRALDAVHNDKRGQWIAAELKAVAEVAGVDLKLTAKDARASARQTIARMTVRDAMAAQRFLAAERKAAEEAARLGAMLARESVWANAARRRISLKAKSALVGGSIDAVARQIDAANNSTLNRNETVQKLIAAKRRQLMNHALYMEARAVADEVGKAERFVRNLNKASTREKIAGSGRRENAQTDYLAALDEILDRYDFRRMSGRAEDRRGALAAFIESMTAAGRENELAIPEAVLRDAGRKPYKTLSVEELRGVIDSLKNIQHVATRWNDLIDGQNQRKLDEAVAEITAAFDENMPKRPPGRVATTGEGVRNSVRQFLDLVLNAGTILREIDGFKDMGAAYRNLKAPIDAAMDRLTVRKEKAAADLEALYAVYSKEERRRMAVREHIPALGYALSKWERIAVALNTGNEGNMQRLTDPRVRGSLTPAQVAAVLSTLDERDARFVQSVWDYVGSFRDDIAAREKRTTGVEPAWVEASPVVIGGMTLRGGYYPLKYDPRLSTLARDDEAQAIGEALQAGRFGKAQTKRGHLEARAKSSGRDVELDMSVLHRHVNQVIYDLELSEPVANSWKVLQSGGVRQAFMDAGRQADFDALETWLKDVAEGQLAAGDWINKNARRFKSNFTAAKLAFNIGTVAAQITGLSQTMVVVGKRDFLRGLQASFRAGVADEIAAKSAFMRQRQTTFNKDIADFYSDPKLGPYASRWGDIKRDWIGPASFWLMTKVQWFTVDIPTWLAGYQQGLRKFGGDEAKAIAHADAIVKRAQASGLFSDRSAIERGSVSRTTRQNDVVRLFTTLGSYMFAKFNVAYERTMVAGRTVREEGVSVKSAHEAASWALDVAFLFTLEAVAMAALKGKLPDDEDDEDEPGWAKFLAKETAMSVLGTIPFVRDVVSVGSGFEGGGAYGGITAEIAKPFQEIGQGEIDKGFVKSVISGTGLFTGLPSTQINRAVDAGWRAAEGEDVSPLEYLLGKRGK